MQTVAPYIDEEEFGRAILRYKSQQAFKPLIQYLILAISSGCMPPDVQARAYNELGLAHLQSENAVEAEKAFLSAIDRSPKKVNPRFNLANLMLYAQRYEEGFKRFEQVLKLDADHAGALHHSGLCCAMQKQYAKALVFFEKSFKITGDTMGPAFWSGECLLQMGAFDRALPYFKRALIIMPEHEESLRGLAICLYEEKEFTESLQICDSLIANGGGAEYLALRIKGDALLALGKGEAAAYCHLELAQMDFDAREYLKIRSEALNRQGSDQAAVYTGIISEKLKQIDADFLGLSQAI
ncbi:MAG: tetratricopeptide repeat protein [Proteobacteria bacterium]|nr:tetratricopeptide repeat protein [Pseudomonadota bacterium]